MDTPTDTYVNLIINRLNRSQYDELCCTPGGLSEWQLYLIDDDNFDAFGKTIVNVGEPSKDTDGVNVGYLSSNYIKQTEVDTFVDKTKLTTSDALSCLSVDGTIATSKFYDEDWIPSVKSGSYTSDQLTVYYNGTKGTSGTDFGWTFNVNNEFQIYTNDQNVNQTSINGRSDEHSLIVTAVRSPRWENKDALVLKSTIKNSLDGIESATELNAVIAILKKLYTAVST